MLFWRRGVFLYLAVAEVIRLVGLRVVSRARLVCKEC